MKDDAPFNMISGTMGLSGSADGSYVLVRDNRMSAKAKLFITGRDIPDIELRLEFDKVNCLWKLTEHDVYDEFDNDEPKRFVIILGKRKAITIHLHIY